MPTAPLFYVDAFTATPFRGNPAAVCLLAEPRSARWRQAVAAEMNLSETAFVEPRRGGFRLCWFTPVVEVDLCGHATLAAAHVLWSEGLAPSGAVLRFATRSGVLTARWLRRRRIALDFPARPPAPVRAPARLMAALGARPRAVARAADDLLVELESAPAVRDLAPDFGRLRRLAARGVIVTARASGRYDFVSRFFAPAVGVAEDPVTGSAHCALAPYWGVRLGKQRLRGHQVSARGGEVEVELAGDRVQLLGAAVTVARGQLLV